LCFLSPFLPSLLLSFSFYLLVPSLFSDEVTHARLIDWYTQVIWNSDGALAGLRGTAAVGLTVEGLPLSSSPSSSSGSGSQATSNYLVLAGLPFQGSVRINKSLLKA
jgi:hypothetical protein